ncbi:MAG: 1-hydroxycarotenoid 3,4-desaturase CrtD [Pseudomonadota bacterium]
MDQDRVIVVGGGVGGLSAALTLASRGLPVTLLEAQPDIGGKMRALPVGKGQPIDSGPTVFTMRWVFEELFEEAGLTLSDELALTRADLLARHAWDTSGHFDLYADLEQSADSVGGFFGQREAKSFRKFAKQAAEMYALLEEPFLKSPKPTTVGLSKQLGLRGFKVRPFSSLHQSLAQIFDDPRLVQLFGRYSTYTGASPYLAPATLMLIAHVELDGVWLIKGGMRALAQKMREACENAGVEVRTNAPVATIEVSAGKTSAAILADGERLPCAAIIANCDASAIGSGLFGKEVAGAVEVVKPTERSLSAIAWTLRAKAMGFPLSHHTVFFGKNYPEEFDATFKRSEFPADPTVYICAQDRTADEAGEQISGSERMLMVINAPPNGDSAEPNDKEMNQCMDRAMQRLEACGLTVEPEPDASLATGPTAFNELFPATGGALYGRANHSPFASFKRPSNRTQIPGLYLAGGSVHPGPGVPMAALSGRLAAAELLADRASRPRFRRTATIGGMSTG